MSKKYLFLSMFVAVAAVFAFAALSLGKDQLPFKAGDNAPSFIAKDSDGKTYKSGELFKTGPSLFVFYPGDETPGCTKQLCAIRDDYKMFSMHGIQVFGVNQADAASHNSFIKNQKYQFPLIVDEGFALSKAFGAFKDGDPYITRTVALVGADGKFIFYERGMPEDTAIIGAYHKSLGGECPVCAQMMAEGSNANESDCQCGPGCHCGGNPCTCKS